MLYVASLRYGTVFKKAFSDPAIFTAFVKDMLDVDIEIERVETEKSFDPPVGNVDVEFDLYAEDRKHRIIVDIQHERYGDHYDRFLYYHCIALAEQIKNAGNYRPGLKVFTIVVLTSGDRHHRDVAITDFAPHDLRGRALAELPHKILWLCPKYADDQTPEPYREWLRAIDDSLDGQVEETRYQRPAIQQVFQHIERGLITPHERAQMIEETHAEELRQRKELRVRIKIARAMLAKQMDTALIAEITGLALDDLGRLIRGESVTVDDSDEMD